MPKIAVGKGENTIDAIKKVVEYLGGIEKFVKTGQSVFIKPDLSVPIGVPATTDPLIIGYVVKSCFKAGANQVMVGDNPFGGISSKNLYKFTGLDAYLNNIGASLKYLENEPHEVVDITNPSILKEVKLPRCLLESDVFISIPRMRTDILSDVALSIRNLHGLLPDEQYYQIYKEGIHEGLTDVLKAIIPDLIIMDCFVGGEGQGPFKLSGVETKFNLGSTDSLLMDSIASSIMGFKHQEIKHLKLAGEMNRGSTAPLENIIVGDNFKKFNFKRAELISGQNELLKVHQGKCCSGCLASFRIFSDLMNMFLEKELKKYGGFTCLLGKNPEVKSFKRGIIVFGDCAMLSTQNMPFRTDKKMRKIHRIQEIEGCPPVNLNIFEKIAVNFKDKLPAFELMNEILKRWTRGRKLQVPRHPQIGE